VVMTQRGACKRMRLKEITKSCRAKRGLLMLRELKSKPHRITSFFVTHEKDTICFQINTDETHHVVPLELSESDRYSNGSFIIDSDNQKEVNTLSKIANYEKPFDQTSE